MEIAAEKVLGNTWCIKMLGVMIPYYQLNEKDIILIDSGCALHGELEAWIEEQGVHVCAILNTHEHWDHVLANHYLQQKHGAKIYMPVIEASWYRSKIVQKQRYGKPGYEEGVPYEINQYIGEEDGKIEVCGAEFEVIHTPGHSIDHVVYITPDRVMCVGDLLMSRSLMSRAKISYAYNHRVDLDSKAKLHGCDCRAFVLAHESIEEGIDELIDENILYIRCRAEEIWHLIDHPMSMEEIVRMTWKKFDLHDGSPYQNYEKGLMIRSLVQYLYEEKKLECRYREGVDYYARSKGWEDISWN